MDNWFNTAESLAYSYLQGGSAEDRAIELRAIREQLIAVARGIERALDHAEEDELIGG